MNILLPDIIFGLFSDLTCLYLLTKLFFRERLNFSWPSYIPYITVQYCISEVFAESCAIESQWLKSQWDCPFNYYCSFVIIVTNDSVNTTASCILVMKAFKSKLEFGISMSSTYVSYNLFSHLFYIIPRHYCKIYDSFFIWTLLFLVIHAVWNICPEMYGN